MNWIEWARARQPFALVVDSFDAHEPWDAPRRLVDMYGPPRPDGIEPIQPFADAGGPVARARDLAGPPAADAPALRRRGHACRRLARPLPRPARQPRARRATRSSCWCSDHGVLLGEYGWVGKRYSEMHQALTHVPLIMRHPARKAKGAVTSYYASTHDIGPTVLSAPGIDVPDHMDGVDLSPSSTASGPRRSAATARPPTTPTSAPGTTAGCSSPATSARSCASTTARPIPARRATSPRATLSRSAGSGT